MLPGAATSASSVPLPWAGRKDNGTYARWLPLSHIDLGSEKAIYLPSRGKTGVSRLQRSQQRCANAAIIDKVKPGATICSGGKMQAMHGLLTNSPALKIKGKQRTSWLPLLLAWPELCHLHCRKKCLFYTPSPSQRGAPAFDRKAIRHI